MHSHEISTQIRWLAKQVPVPSKFENYKNLSVEFVRRFFWRANYRLQDSIKWWSMSLRICRLLAIAANSNKS